MLRSTVSLGFCLSRDRRGERHDQLHPGDGAPGLAALDQGGGNAVLAGIPVEDDVGTHDISLRVTDSHGASSTQDFTITVTGVNSAPVFTSTAVSVALVDQVYLYEITTFDEESDTLTILPDSPLPAWLGLLDAGDGTAKLAGIPIADDLGDVVIELEVVDSHGAVGFQSFTLSVSDD